MRDYLNSAAFKEKAESTKEIYCRVLDQLSIEHGHKSLRNKAFDPIYYGAWFAQAIDDAGLPDDCVLHGLRKCAARHLAEAGCSESEIMAITGHRTSRMVGHYTKAANKKQQATAAIVKLELRRK